MKKVLAFDLDDTLGVTKSPISDEMAELLVQTLEHFEVCVISGGAFEQFKNQVVDRLQADARLLNRLHLMPTCGTRYYRYEEKTDTWKIEYAEDLSDSDKKKIIKVLEECAKELGYWEKNTAGEIIEDRHSQITYSALGQRATPEDKYAWDPDHSKKWAIQRKAAPLLPGLEVRVGGSTSIDVTKVGIDKAYGMKKLIEALDITKEDILFFGDRIKEGGNDYPVKMMGIDCIEVSDHEDTEGRLEAIIATIK